MATEKRRRAYAKPSRKPACKRPVIRHHIRKRGQAVLLNVSSLYFFFAVVRERLEELSALITAQHLAWGAAGAAALFAVLRIALPPPRGGARTDWPAKCRTLGLACEAALASVILYKERSFLLSKASPLLARLGIPAQDAGLWLALAVLLAAGAAVFAAYLKSPREPGDSALNRRQKLGLALILLLALAVLLAARRFAYAYYADFLLRAFVAIEILNLAFWFYDPLIYLLSRLIRLPARPAYPPTPSYLNRFAVIGCAHNEEAVIEKLIESVYKNAYPKDCYDVYVICDNCTDGTAERVRRAGGIPMVRETEDKRGKGYALEWMFAILEEKRQAGDAYDAYVILDADNVVNEAYLDAVNSKLNEGHEIVQTYLGCKNPDDTWVSKAHSLSYWLSNVNYQDAHSRMGLSAQMGGTGMVLRPSALDAVGWNTDSLTEDLALTSQYVRVCRRPCAWAHEARLYDEKPLELRASIRQRTRWMQGHMDAAVQHGVSSLFMGVVHMSWLELDMAFYLLRPLLNLIMFATFLIRWFIALFAPASPLNRAFMMTPAAASLLLVFYLLMQVYALYREGYRRSALWIPLGYAYALTWYLPILRGLIKRNEKRWVSTAHTRNMSISEIKDDTTIDEAIGRLHGIDNLHRMTLGQILVKSATITSEQLNAALERQRAGGGHLGEIIVGMQVMSKETLDVYLTLQKSLRDKAETDSLPAERLRLGELLVDAEIITQGQLDDAMAYQKEHNCLLGESLVNTKAMNSDTLATFLNIQRVLDENYLTPQRALHLINGIMRESVSNLGMLLFAGGLISQYQLDVALAHQKEHGGVLGEIIARLGFVNQDHIDALLEIQRSSRAARARKERGAL